VLVGLFTIMQTSYVPYLTSNMQNIMTSTAFAWHNKLALQVLVLIFILLNKYFLVEKILNTFDTYKFGSLFTYPIQKHFQWVLLESTAIISTMV
jgi:hypothetical protein